MIIAGLLFLVLGYVLGVGVLVTVGWILVAVGIVLILVGAGGYPIAGRRHWY